MGLSLSGWRWTRNLVAFPLLSHLPHLKGEGGGGSHIQSSHQRENGTGGGDAFPSAGGGFKKHKSLANNLRHIGGLLGKIDGTAKYDKLF